MTDKLIYVVPEPGVQGFKTAFTDHSIDVPFRIEKESVLGRSDVTYQIPCGMRTYAPPECGGILLLPRSKASLLWPKDQISSERKPWNRTSVSRVLSSDTLPDTITMYEPCDLRLTNTVGYIDWSYRGEWMARCSVRGRVQIEPGKPLLQAVPINTEYKFLVVESINDVPEEIRSTQRGEGGYGSTDQATPATEEPETTSGDDSEQTADN